MHAVSPSVRNGPLWVEIGRRKKRHYLATLINDLGSLGTSLRVPDLGGMNDEVIRNMRARIEQCRRLAKNINDPRTTEALQRMADEAEADLARLEADDRARR